jgi:predicted GH43/DUF377 family glycosyl hydrolase
MTLKQEALMARRRTEIRNPDCTRIIAKFFLPGDEHRVRGIIQRVLALSEDEVQAMLDQVMKEFSHRHRRFRHILEKHFHAVTSLVPVPDTLSEARKLLLGAYFTNEYSVQCAGLFNPSIVPHPDQSGMKADSLRFIMSFRGIGEGHISSLEFRSGILDEDSEIIHESISPFLEMPDVVFPQDVDRSLLIARLSEEGLSQSVQEQLQKKLPKRCRKDELVQLAKSLSLPEEEKNVLSEKLVKVADWFLQNNYEIRFDPETQLSERVIYPISPNECKGLEDARFVYFQEDDDSVTYYATYTGYNGYTIQPKLLETKDFVTFKVTTMAGPAVTNKTMALFPRRIGGKYAMLSRQDGESMHIMFSDNLYVWQESEVIRTPSSPWELIQIGTGSPPIETEEGWLVVNHGVGPMRKYCIGVELLDLEDPRRVIRHLEEPILSPNEKEREGYVPNVVYTCGALIHGGELIIPYAMSDWASGIASIPVKPLLDQLVEPR